MFWATIYPTWNGTNDRYFLGTSAGLFSTALLNGDNTIWEMEAIINGLILMALKALEDHEGGPPVNLLFDGPTI